jgi:hypothetical protein
MAKLKDYSGPFKPDLKLTDFSSEALANLLVAAGQLYLGADGMWNTIIRKHYGEKVAYDLSMEVWSHNFKHEVDRPRKAMNIGGNDIATLFKTWQCDPGWAVMFDIDFKLSKDGKKGTLTVTRCRTLEYCERHNDMWLLKHACEDLDGTYIPASCEYLNPKIKCKATKLPPRKSPNDIPCQWEFWMED